MRRSRDWRGRVTLITGAASGIGRATALAFARRGAALELVDRDAAGLARVLEETRAAGAERVQEHVVDVSSEVAVSELARRVQSTSGALEVLVNAAGVAVVGSFLDTTLDDWSWVLGVNLWGTIWMSRAFAPEMVAQGRGQIVNVASVAAFFAPTSLIAYGVSKAAVVSFSETLRAELADKGVGVSVICPGFVDTPILANARVRGALAAERAAIHERTVGRGIPPERVADAIVEAVRRDRALVPVAAEAWGLYLLKRLTPSLLSVLVRRLARRDRPPSR